MFEIAENSRFLPSIRHYCIHFCIHFGKSGNSREKIFWYFYSNCNDLNLCKSSSIRVQLVRNQCILSIFLLLLFDDCSSAAKYFDLFLIHVEMVFLGTLYFSAMSLFERPFSSSLKAWNFSSKLFTLSCRLAEDMLLPEMMLKKERAKFVSTVINIRMPEMNGMILSKTWFEYSK